MVSGAFTKYVVWQHSKKDAWNRKNNVGVRQYCGAFGKCLYIVRYPVSLVRFHWKRALL